jgi:hypothetical protein
LHALTPGHGGEAAVKPFDKGLLGRLRVRLDQNEGAALEPEQPIEYERDNLGEDIEYLATFPQVTTARDLGERRVR